MLYDTDVRETRLVRETNTGKKASAVKIKMEIVVTLENEEADPEETKPKMEHLHPPGFRELLWEEGRQ